MTRLISLFCLAALAGPGAALATERDVKIQGRVFQPQTVRLLPGDAARWTNWDFEAHDVESDDGGATFKSGDLDRLVPWTSPALASTGTVTYHCVRHPAMKGAVSVRPAWLTTPPLVTYPNGVTLRGLAPNGEEAAVQRLSGVDWVDVDSTTVTAEDGAFQLPLAAPAVPGTYKAVVPGGESLSVKVAVKPRMTIAKKRLPRKRFRVTAGVNVPAHAGVQVALQKRTSFGWKRIAAKKLNLQRKAAFVVAPKKGTWRLRVVVKAARGYTAAQSPVIAVKR